MTFDRHSQGCKDDTSCITGVGPTTGKGKVTWSYIVASRETSMALRHASHSFTCKLHYACLYLVSIHQMAIPLTCDNVRLIAAYYSPIDPERMKG